MNEATGTSMAPLASSTETAIHPKNRLNLEQVDGEADHWICCRDEHITYCGKFDPTPFEGYAAEVECEECMAIDRADELGMFCPVRPRCLGPSRMTHYCKNR